MYPHSLRTIPRAIGVQEHEQWNIRYKRVIKKSDWVLLFFSTPRHARLFEEGPRRTFFSYIVPFCQVKASIACRSFPIIIAGVTTPSSGRLLQSSLPSTDMFIVTSSSSSTPSLITIGRRRPRPSTASGRAAATHPKIPRPTEVISATQGTTAAVAIAPIQAIRAFLTRPVRLRPTCTPFPASWRLA